MMRYNKNTGKNPFPDEWVHCNEMVVTLNFYPSMDENSMEMPGNFPVYLEGPIVKVSVDFPNANCSFGQPHLMKLGYVTEISTFKIPQKGPNKWWIVLRTWVANNLSLLKYRKNRRNIFTILTTRTYVRLRVEEKCYPTNLIICFIPRITVTVNLLFYC